MSKNQSEHIVSIQHVFISTELDNTGIFTQYIDIPFIPKKMIIRSVAYENDVTEPGVSLIRCFQLNRSPSGFLCSIRDGSQNNVNAEFLIDFPIRGTFQFEVILATGGNIDTTRSGELCIDLEFIE